jgi:MSHA biogenesis protein MshM
MYEQHFGLREAPFGITPDTSYYFANHSAQDAFNTLRIALSTGEGFVKVVGEVGTGKTLLCRKLLNAFEADGWITAYVPNPYLEPRTLLKTVADELGIHDATADDQHALLKAISVFLIESSTAGRRVLLCLDEAQSVPLDTMEALRLLSNLETERRKLIQIVLFGQPELDEHLNQPGLRQLKSRIGFSCRLAPLPARDTDDYLAHRLRVAGYGGPRLFSDRATRMLYRACGGVPRLANVLAHKSLMAAYGEGAREVAARHVRLAVADTESVQHAHGWRRVFPWLHATLAAAGGSPRMKRT